MKRFALSLPPPTDERFDQVRQHLINLATREAAHARAQCAIANGVSFFETEAVIAPDPDRPNVIMITARVLL